MENMYLRWWRCFCKHAETKRAVLFAHTEVQPLGKSGAHALRFCS